MSRACLSMVLVAASGFCALSGCLVLSGCSVVNAYEDPALVGSWELEIDPNSDMDVELDGDGDAKLFSTNGEIRYDLDWTQEKEDEFDIDFKCKSHPFGCDQQDFKMVCDASSSGDNLDCQALSNWDPPDFEWTRKD